MSIERTARTNEIRIIAAEDQKQVIDTVRVFTNYTVQETVDLIKKERIAPGRAFMSCWKAEDDRVEFCSSDEIVSDGSIMIYAKS